MAKVRFETKQINDWQGFHEVSQATFGFPDFYGSNMDAWIDCLTYLNEGDGMSKFELAHGEPLEIEMTNSADFMERQPEIFKAIIECTALVNSRYVEGKVSARVTLTFV